MIQILIIIILFLLPAVSPAEPFLTCDAQGGVTRYKVVWGAPPDQSIEYSDATADGAARHDLSNRPAGTHAGEIFAGKPYTIEGQAQPAYKWGDPSPFSLGVPSIVSVPENVSVSDGTQ